METIVLDSKKSLDTYMNPQRQRLLREMRLVGEPMTPKQLSLRMGISPSSVQHHIAKLVELGVVELHHTANIRGITARYYIHAPVIISFGLRQDDGTLLGEREIHVQKMLSDVQQGFFDAYRRRKEAAALEQKDSLGDILSGIIYLTQEEGQELLRQILAFTKSREQKQPGQQAWEYALVAYNAEEAAHEEES